MACALKFEITSSNNRYALRHSLRSFLGPRSGWTPSLFGFGYTKTKGHIWLASVRLAKRRIS